jgi:hypothetical protein
MRPKPILLENGNHFTDFSANENGFGCVQNQSYWKMEIILQILALMKMVLDASKTNSKTNANKLANL